MNHQDRLDALYDLLADVEAKMQNPTLPHSDQQLLDQAWEAYTNEIDELEDILEMAHEIDETDWRDAEVYLASQEADDDYQESNAAGGSVTVRSGFAVRNGEVKIVTYAPPPPVDRRPASPALLLPSEEELEMLNAMTDTREDCARCAGCIYCNESAAYDGADEI